MRIATLAAAILLIGSVGAPAQDLFDQAVVRDFHFTFPQANWWNDILASKTSGQDVKGDLVVDGVTYPDVGLRIKGASSSSVQGSKKPFNLTMDAFTPGQSLYGFDTLNLNNGAVDPTLTRETISYEMFRDYLPTPRTAYVRVHLNGTYWGIYILVEQPDKNFIGAWFDDDTGSRYKGDKPTGATIETSTLVWFGPGLSNYTSRYEIKTPNHPDAWTDLIGFIDKLNNLPAATFKTEIEKVLNVDRALWYFVVMNLFVNSDDYVGAGHNYYMYFDPADGRMNMLPWDLNESFGVHGPATNPWLYPVNKAFTATNRPLVRRLMEVPEWRELYYAHYRTAMKQWMDWDTVIGPLNDQYQNLILQDFLADTNYLYPNQWNPSFPGKVFLSFHWVHGLKEVTVNRKAFLLTQHDLIKPEPLIDNVTLLTPAPTPGQMVHVTARVTGFPTIQEVALRYAQVGAFQSAIMKDDGLSNDGVAGDGVYGGSFPAGDPLATMRYYIHATDMAGTVQVEPKRAEHVTFEVDVGTGPPAGPVVINELLADNDTVDQDEAGDFDDWVEIHNPTPQAYDLTGHYLSDDASQPKRWSFPPGTVVPALGFLRVWADDEPGEGPLHATFKLSGNGESAVLTGADTAGNPTLDAIAFPDQKGDRSYGRVPDGGEHLFFIWDPTGAQPFLTLGTSNRYDGRQKGSAADFDLDASGLAKVGAQFSLDFTGGVPGGAAALFISVGTDLLEVPPFGVLGIDLTTSNILMVPLDNNGDLSLAGPVPTLLGGFTLYFQAASQDLSNALGVSFAP